MAEQQVAYTEYQDKQADLTSQQAEAAAVLATLNTKSAEYAKQLASVQTLQSSISKQVSNMQAQLDEQKRIEAEEKAAQAASSDNSSSSPWYGDSAGSATGQEIVDYAKKFLGSVTFTVEALPRDLTVQVLSITATDIMVIESIAPQPRSPITAYRCPPLTSNPVILFCSAMAAEAT